MSFNIEEELQKTFHEAVQQHEAKTLRTPEDWRALINIQNETAELIRDANERYLSEYDTRVEVVRKRLIDQAGRLNFDHPTPFGNDRFDGDATNRQANREVQFDHMRVIEQIKDFEVQKTEGLKSTAHDRDHHRDQSRENIHGKAREAFESVSDRRKGPDRRR